MSLKNIKEIKKHASDLMRTEQFQECETIINKTKIEVGVVIVGLMGPVGFMTLKALQIRMLISLSKIFGVNLSKKVAGELFTKFYALSVLHNFLQAIGGAIAVPLAILCTEYLGWAAVLYFAKFGKQTESKDFEPSKADPRIWKELSETKLKE